MNTPLKLQLQCDNPLFEGDLMDLIRAYYPYVEDDAEGDTLCVMPTNDATYTLSVRLHGREWRFTQEKPLTNDPIVHKRYYKRFVKKYVYDVLKECTGVALPYGSLTGIRPTKLYYDLVESGVENVREQLIAYYEVSPEKVDLIEDIVATQKGIYRQNTHAFDHFANIPLCPTRCAYCSFIAEVVSKVKKDVPAYVDNLARSISTFWDCERDRRAIYVGGGTPTSIAPEELRKVLMAFRADGCEFTVEAGRPETITPEMVAVCKEAGVTRISVNPQTFKDETLRKIGRAHSTADTLRAYDLVKDSGMDVNMDLIAMLPDETLEDFASSLEQAIALHPANITVHSLSIKRGSTLCLMGYGTAVDNELACAMSEYAYKRLKEAGYMPYYMYRQKNTQGRLENVGYTLPGKACVYNIDIMEETHSVHASGAGAISKRVFEEEGRIERLSEHKEIKGFNQRIEELIAKKRAFFDE